MSGRSASTASPIRRRAWAMFSALSAPGFIWTTLMRIAWLRWLVIGDQKNRTEAGTQLAAIAASPAVGSERPPDCL